MPILAARRFAAVDLKRLMHPELKSMSVIKKLLLAASVFVTFLAVGGPAYAQGVCEPQKLATKFPSLVGKTIKIGADPQNPPYVMRDPADFNKVVGVDADLASAVLDCEGVKHEFFLGGWAGLLPAVMSGQIDVMWDNLYYKPERAKSADFVLYMKAGTGALAAAGNPKKVTAVADFCGKTVAFGLGSVEETISRKQDAECKAAGKAGVDMMPFQDLAAGIRLIDSGRADILLWDLGFIDAMVAANRARYARAFAIFNDLTIGAAITKGNADLRNAILEGMKTVQANGTQAAIFKKYGVDTRLIVPAEVKTD